MYRMPMMPPLPLGHRLAPPLLFLLLIGGAIAIADYWIRSQLPQTPAPVTTSKARGAPAGRPRRRRLIEPREM